MILRFEYTFPLPILQSKERQGAKSVSLSCTLHCTKTAGKNKPYAHSEMNFSDGGVPPCRASHSHPKARAIQFQSGICVRRTPVFQSGTFLYPDLCKRSTAPKPLAKISPCPNFLDRGLNNDLSALTFAKRLFPVPSHGLAECRTAPATGYFPCGGVLSRCGHFRAVPAVV